MATHIYQATFGFVGVQQFAAIVQHFKIEDPTASDWDTAFQMVANMIDDGGLTSLVQVLADLISEDAFISSLRIRQIRPTGGNTAVQVFLSTDFVGTRVGEIHASQVAATLIFPSEAADAKFGRNFIPFISEDDLDGNRFTNDFKDAAIAYAAKLTGGGSITSGDYLPVVYNREDFTSFLIENAYLSSKVGTQRRRLSPI